MSNGVRTPTQRGLEPVCVVEVVGVRYARRIF